MRIVVTRLKTFFFNRRFREGVVVASRNTTSLAHSSMSPTAFPAEACAEARAVLATPLFEVLRAVTSKKDTPAHLGRQGQKPKVVTLEHNTTLSDALETLARHRILGAPVLIQPDPLHADESCHDVHYDDSAGRERPVLLGFFDVGDALRELVRALPPEEEPEKVPVPPPRADESPQVVLPAKHGRNVLSWMRVLDAVERQVANAKLISLLGDDAELLYRADANAEGHTFVQTISKGFLDKKSANGAVHRIAIFDGTGEITQIMTMSDAVQYIASNVLSLKTLCKMSLQDLGFVGDERSGSTSTKQKLVAVPPTTPAIEAFAMMCASGVSGVGVLDDVGVLIANLSVSDVRCIQPEHFGVLGLPVAEFLALLHGTSYAGFSGAYVRLSQIQAHCLPVLVPEETVTSACLTIRD